MHPAHIHRTGPFFRRRQDAASPARRPPSRRAGIAVRLAVLVAVAAVTASAPAPAAAASGDIGYESRSFSGTATPTGTKRAESKLWWNDGFWWAHMWDTGSGEFGIFKLDTATQTWTAIGVPVDTRSHTHADVLWDGRHLYVASHKYVRDEDPAVAGSPSYLYRFRYDAVGKRYALDPGFPVMINKYATETLVIDKDSTGTLWATWQQGNQIYVNATAGDDRIWGVPFALPVAGTAVTVDDISSVAAFGGNKIGVMWSNQGRSGGGVYFAVHVDGQPALAWEPSRMVAAGRGYADDHINLKALHSDGSGRLFAVVKTSFGSSTQPLALLLARDPATGEWAHHRVASVAECPNRPMLVIDGENRALHVFYTAPAPPSYFCTPKGGAILKKTSSLDAISFSSGSGTPVILDADSAKVNNASATKQNVTRTSAIAVLAVNTATDRYWHEYEPALPAPRPPPPPASRGGTTASGATVQRGTAGRDVVVGTAGNDVIYGFGGNDVIRGLGGNDVLYGGAGDDSLFGGTGSDRLVGAGGRDWLAGGGGRDRLLGGFGRDRLLGGYGRDRLVGHAGGDSITGGAGGDVLRGGSGRDTLLGSGGNDTFYARDRRRDTIRGGRGTDRGRTDRVDRVSGVERRF